jgi:hypothetical protein
VQICSAMSAVDNTTATLALRACAANSVEISQPVEMILSQGGARTPRFLSWCAQLNTSKVSRGSATTCWQGQSNLVGIQAATASLHGCLGADADVLACRECVRKFGFPVAPPGHKLVEGSLATFHKALVQLHEDARCLAQDSTRGRVFKNLLFDALNVQLDEIEVPGSHLQLNVAGSSVGRRCVRSRV